MTWRAQAGQDRWVHERHPAAGYFVDVGAHDGVTHSNTWALERLGWTGICLEPNRRAYDELRANRPRSICAPWAASSSYDYVRFDGIRLLDDDEKARDQSRVATVRLAGVLDDFGAPPVIDYLSIDVEGHEIAVLAGMDFDRWRVGLITVEHNLYCDGPARKAEIFEHLTGRGFERVVEDVVAEGYGPFEDWYAPA